MILCHGMESCKEGEKSVALAGVLAAGGCDVLRFDFSYVGESGGRFADLTVTGEVDDLAGAWEFARRRVRGPIGIVGSSLGGTVALLFAAQEPDVAALATIAAVATPGAAARRLSEEEKARWRSSGWYDLYGTRVGAAFLDDVIRLDVPAALRGLHCPLFLAHGSADEVVPCGAVDVIAGAVAGAATVRLFPGVDHRFSDAQSRSAMLDEIAAFMLARLGSAVGGDPAPEPSTGRAA